MMLLPEEHFHIALTANTPRYIPTLQLEQLESGKTPKSVCKDGTQVSVVLEVSKQKEATQKITSLILYSMRGTKLLYCGYQTSFPRGIG